MIDDVCDKRGIITAADTLREAVSQVRPAKALVRGLPLGATLCRMLDWRQLSDN